MTIAESIRVPLESAKGAIAPLFVVATPGGSAPALASLVQQMLRPEPSVRVEVRTAVDIGPALREHPGARLVAIVEDPADALAGSLHERRGEAASLLASWQEGARLLLRAVQANPRRVLCIDAEDFRRAPDDVARAVSDWQGLAQALTGAERLEPPAPEPGPLEIALGQAVIAADPAAYRLTEELLACCAVVGPTAPRQRPDPIAALAEYEGLRTQTAALEDEAGRLRAEGNQTRQALTAREYEGERLLLTLHQTQEELEATLLEGRRSEEQLRKLNATVTVAAERAQRLAAESAAREQVASAQLTRLRSELADAKRARAAESAVREQAAAAELAGLRKALADAERALAHAKRASADENAVREQAAAAELAGLRKALADAERARADESAVREQEAAADLAGLRKTLAATQREHELLVAQLHQVQEELEHLYLQCAAFEASATQSALGIGLLGERLRVRAVTQTGVADAPPHRHLHLRIDDLALGSCKWPMIEVRLVEHFGHPGLALFGGPAGRNPTSAWHCSGKEDQREFMLLIPQDAHSVRLLQLMGTSDWNLVIGLAVAIEGHLANTASARAAQDWRWSAVAMRLHRQLADLPPRLRYDSLRSEREAQGLVLTFVNAVFGELHLGDVSLLWQLQSANGDAGPLVLLAPADGGSLPLAHWPVQADGQPAARFSLPVGGKWPGARKRRAWAGLTDRDRAIVLALLDALPAGARHATDAVAAAPGQAESACLARDASALYREARRLSVSLSLRTLIGKALRRGGRPA